jgi:hypothetical protein
MGFSDKQVQALRRHLDERQVRTRESNGRELSYIEGWYAISEANRIFGFDGWNRETLDSKCVLARENRGAFTAVYTAKVRITVQADGVAIVREGHGTGEGRGDTPGEVHDTALKAAETDATKRALATFGRPFGLELYRGGRMSPVKARTRTAASGSTSRAAPSVGTNHPGRSGTPIDAAGSPSTAATLPSDTGPIPRPSRHYGRQRYLESRNQNAALMQEASRRASETSLVPPQPDLLPLAKIDKSVLTFAEPKRLRDKAHLKFVGSQPCLVCGRQPADAHHLRFAQPRALGMKVSDEFTVPLCRGHHREVHRTGNEPAWWEDLEINALEIARGLWEQSRGLNVSPATSGQDLTTTPETGRK